MANFHAGEIYWQAQFDMANAMAPVGDKALRSFMPDQHRQFFPLLPFLLIGSVNDHLQPTASILTGMPGFAWTPDEASMQIHSMPLLGDALNQQLMKDRPLGILGIQPHTRRRNRVNGWVVEKNNSFFSIAVQQSFGNCPKYIVERELEFFRSEIEPAVQEYTEFTPEITNLISESDTFYIATAHPDCLKPSHTNQGVDVSHRAGAVGFIQIEGRHLVVPSFRGNFFYNTLGNIYLNPKVGLLFLDFKKNLILQLDAIASFEKNQFMQEKDLIQGWMRLEYVSAKLFRNALNVRLVKSA